MYITNRTLCYNLVYRVIDVTKKEKSKARPQALNTVEMLRVASSGLGEFKDKPCFEFNMK